MRVFSLATALLASLALLGSSPAGAFTLVPDPILLGTTEEAQEVTPSGTATLRDEISASEVRVSLDAEVAFPAVIVHPDETGIGGLHASLSAGPALIAFEGSDLVWTFDDLTLTLDGGGAGSIFATYYNFALDPVTMLLPPLTLRIPYPDIVAGRARFSIPLDVEFAFPPSGPPAPLVILGTLQFSQVPEPRLLLLGAAALPLIGRFRRG